MLDLIKRVYSKLNFTFTVEEKFYINVPYAEKDKAKELGAKWDPTKKSWYITKELNQIDFEKWIQKENEKNTDSNIRSMGFFVVESLESCWKCKQDTPVFAFLLPENHQTKEYEDEDDDEENDRVIWRTENYRSIVSFSSSVNKRSIDILHRFSPHYYFDSSKQSSGSYYMNHCKNCNSKLGDFYMHSEPGGAFQPTTREAAEAMKLYWFDEIFEASVGTYLIDVYYFDHMQIIFM